MARGDTGILLAMVPTFYHSYKVVDLWVSEAQVFDQKEAK